MSWGKKSLLLSSIVSLGFVSIPLAYSQEQTIGTGDINVPAIGPSPAYNYDGSIQNYVLVKNWDFGESGTIKNIDSLSEHFQYHDQFYLDSNGGGYGSKIVSPDQENAIIYETTPTGTIYQPIEGVNTDKPVRAFEQDSIKTFLVGLDGAETVHPSSNKAGNGSFQAKWTLPNGGSLLGKDMVWETRVRYVTPPYFWFAIWTAGNKWDNGAEMDLIESFGWDNDCDGCTNFDGDYWHSSVVGGESETDYHSNWPAGMAFYGVTDFDASEYHTWTWVYRADNTFTSYLDGVPVQNGTLNWTVGGINGGEAIDMSFIFDGAWGHNAIGSVNRPLAVSEFEGKFYEWDYSRVYLRDPSAPANNAPTVAFVEPTSAEFTEGDDVYVSANISDVDGDLQNAVLTINDMFVRQENSAPWEWGGTNAADTLLQNLAAGDYTLKITASDSHGAVTEVEKQFTVIAVNQAPEVDTAFQDQTLTVGDNYSVDLEGYFSDPEMMALSFSIVNSNEIPSSISLATSIASGQMTDSDIGEYDINYQACDSEGACTTAIAHLLVEAADEPPTVDDPPVEDPPPGEEDEEDGASTGSISVFGILALMLLMSFRGKMLTICKRNLHS